MTQPNTETDCKRQFIQANIAPAPTGR